MCAKTPYSIDTVRNYYKKSMKSQYKKHKQQK